MIKNVEDIVLLLRPVIATQAEIDLNDVINADSIRGPELTKIVNGQKVPYEPYDNVIIFELNEDTSFDVVETYKDDKIHSIDAYIFNIVIYGDKARTLSKRLRARLLSEKVRGDLSAKGISITSISNIEPSTEMINTVRYIRRDMTIKFITELKFKQIENYEDIEEIKIDETQNS